MVEREHLRALVRKVSDKSASIADRLENLHLICSEAGFPLESKDQAKFISTLGIDALVHISIDEWPPHGDLARSQSKYDAVVPSKGGFWSMRRGAMSALSEMSNYPLYKQQMQELGLYQQLPKMLRHTFPKYHHGISRRYLRRTLKDPTHFICERVVNICANSASVPYIAGHLLEECARMFVEHFVVPDDEGPPGRRGSRETDQASLQGLFEDMGEPSFDILPFEFCRFFANALQSATERKKIELVQMGLLAKLRSCEPPAHWLQARDLASNLAADGWERYLRMNAAEQRAASRSSTDKSLEWRQRGNDLFKAGDYKGAVDAYSRGLRLCSSDVALLTNRSLCKLRLGRLKGAERDACDALAVDACSSKAWCRLGDAYRARRSRQPHTAQLPVMCYATAVKLSPVDAELRARLDEAIDALAGDAPWSVAEIPDTSGGPLAYARWRRWLGLPRRNPRAFLNEDRETRDIERVSGTPKAAASMSIKPAVLRARAMKEVHCVAAQRGAWVASWTDTPLRQASTQLVRHVVNVCSSETGTILGHTMCLGRPSVGTLVATLASATCYPADGSEPCRPVVVLIAHRMSYMYDEVQAALLNWGVGTVCESCAEAAVAAARHGMHPDGLNHEGEYTDEGSSDEDGSESTVYCMKTARLVAAS